MERVERVERRKEGRRGWGGLDRTLSTVPDKCVPACLVAGRAHPQGLGPLLSPIPLLPSHRTPGSHWRVPRALRGRKHHQHSQHPGMEEGRRRKEEEGGGRRRKEGGGRREEEGGGRRRKEEEGGRRREEEGGGRREEWRRGGGNEKPFNQSTFSGFSVGFCINEEGYLLPTIARKITCRHFD